MWTEFEYMYRDAGNNKARRTLLLSGEMTSGMQNEIVVSMENGVYFIAEQIGVPALYSELQQWSSGPTEEDHCWHEFCGFGLLTNSAGVEVDAWGSCATLAERFRSVERWNERLSRNFALGYVPVTLKQA